jgi:DNA (cytosine-5)-methyltransferase 1
VTRGDAKGGLAVVGLFAGIGGIELGLLQAGHEGVMLCEIDEGAREVLKRRFPEVLLKRDVTALKRLPRCDVLAAGFPCQDLSQAGKTAGIGGRNSGLVESVFKLLEDAKSPPRWLLLENVPFMLQLDRGEAMRYLTQRLGSLGYRWAYRIIDARAFGLPQRRKRVILLASLEEDPRGPLLAQDAGEPEQVERLDGLACGFYWTEGVRGLGWAVDAVPTLKGGSTIGIPSPPGIWMPDGDVVVPEIRDAERLQGFETDWTEPAAVTSRRKGARWKLVGNAVSVPVARWAGERLMASDTYDGSHDPELVPERAWPRAAWGAEGEVREARVSGWPVRQTYQHLADFLEHPTQPLSKRATLGFLSRADRSSLRFRDGFLDAVRAHLERMEAEALAA